MRTFCGWGPNHCGWGAQLLCTERSLLSSRTRANVIPRREGSPALVFKGCGNFPSGTKGCHGDHGGDTPGSRRYSRDIWRWYLGRDCFIWIVSPEEKVHACQIGLSWPPRFEVARSSGCASIHSLLFRIGRPLCWVQWPRLPCVRIAKMINKAFLSKRFGFHQS
jgi:hypothetical protein